MGGRRRLRVGTVAVLLAAVAIVGTLAAVGSAAATAKTVTCTSLSGNVSSATIVFTLGGCSGTTGGSGTAQGSTITWANGQHTYLSTPAFTPSGRPKRGNCPALSDRYAVRDIVAGDSTQSIRVGGRVSAEVCIQNEAPDPWSLAPGSVFRLR